MLSLTRRLALGVVACSLLAACGNVSQQSEASATPQATQALHTIPGVEPPLPPCVEVFKDEPGCWVACYKKYEYDGQVHWVEIPGVMRVEGAWDAKHICVPADAQDVDISKSDSKYSKMCTETFVDSCKDAACWAGGDTFAIATRWAREHGR